MQLVRGRPGVDLRRPRGPRPGGRGARCAEESEPFVDRRGTVGWRLLGVGLLLLRSQVTQHAVNGGNLMIVS